MNTSLNNFLASNTFDKLEILIKKIIEKYKLASVNDEHLGIRGNTCRVKFDNNSFYLYLALSNDITISQGTAAFIGFDNFNKYFDVNGGVAKFFISIHSGVHMHDNSKKTDGVSSSIILDSNKKLPSDTDFDLVRKFIEKLINIVNNNEDMAMIKYNL